jgi:hypothetical protein
MPDDLLHALEARTGLSWLPDGDGYIASHCDYELQRHDGLYLRGWVLVHEQTLDAAGEWPLDTDPWDLAAEVAAVLDTTKRAQRRAESPALPGMEIA